MKKILLVICCALTACVPVISAQQNDVPAAIDCGTDGTWLQVLGSGGPEIDDGRASSGYLIWQDGKARVLVDVGGGTALRFEQAGAKLADLEMILLSHLHVDHSADLPVLTKGGYFIDRDYDLPILGPTGNAIMPSTTEFLNRLFAGDQGAWQYLGNYLPDGGRAPYRLKATNYTDQIHESVDRRIHAKAVSVVHGPLPALAWRVEIDGQAIVFSGDMASGDDDFIELLRDANLFVAHNAIPEGLTGVGRRLHMPPSVIGEYAAAGNADRLVISHRMNRTLGREPETLRQIQINYRGRVSFADDLSCYRISN